MKVRWDAYPNHIGHLEFDGCFRCHDDLHISDSGKSISKNCNICHFIRAQGSALNMQMAELGGSLKFMHPSDIEEEDWVDVLCTECHTGLNP